MPVGAWGNPVTGLSRLSWSSGPSSEETGELFAKRTSAIRMSGAKLRNARGGMSMLMKGNAAVELRGSGGDSH